MSSKTHTHMHVIMFCMARGSLSLCVEIALVNTSTIPHSPVTLWNPKSRSSVIVRIGICPKSFPFCLTTCWPHFLIFFLQRVCKNSPVRRCTPESDQFGLHRTFITAHLHKQSFTASENIDMKTHLILTWFFFWKQDNIFYLCRKSFLI